MKIYTKQGDTGTTGLCGGQRVSKDDPRIEAYGTVDELNATLGVVLANRLPSDVVPAIQQVQADLFAIGAELASLVPDTSGNRSIDESDIERLERAIDHYEAELEPLRTFILPGGVRSAAGMQVARTVCRRAERRLVTLAQSSEASVSSTLIIYLNRLGDLLFVLSRHLNAVAGEPDVPWVPRGRKRS